MSKEAEEIRLCKLFLLDPTHHPDNPSKPMKEGMGPYKLWVGRCDKYRDMLDMSPQKSPTRSLIPVRSPTRSLIPVRSPRAETYTRTRLIDTEKLEKEKVNEDLTVRNKLRPMKYTPPLLSLVQLTVDDFDLIKNESYDKFISEVINKTNNNGGSINKNYMNNIAGYDIIVEIPKKYTSKQTGNNILKFHDDKGITNGRLLYNLAQYIRSNYPDYYYFTGLKQEHGNLYKLMINYEGW